MTPRICVALGINSPTEIVSTIYRADVDRARIAGLASAVVEAAQEDRSIFREILEPSGVELARMVTTVARKLGFDPGPLPVALAGGFLLNCPEILQVLETELNRGQFEPICRTVPEPVAGAILLALRALSP